MTISTMSSREFDQAVRNAKKAARKRLVFITRPFGACVARDRRAPAPRQWPPET
jgi:hypothetical protein